MFSHQMLDEIVFAKTFVRAIVHVAHPPLQLAMPFILMPDPIGLALERLGLGTRGEGAGERLDIFMDVF